jgi:hypothetical protein
MFRRMPCRSLIFRVSTPVRDFCKRHPSFVCALVGLALCFPAVGPSLFLDDYVLGLVARGEPRLPGLAQGRFDLFAFAPGRVELNHTLVTQGLLLPWWSDPELKVVFFRPLSSITHHLDFVAWPDTPELMYLHSLLWLGAAIVVAARLYRSFAMTRAEGIVAGLLFAVNDANGAAASWLSNRNVLVAVLFGMLALAAHHRARSAGRLCSGATILWILAGLAAGEIGVWAFAYLLAYSLVFDRDTAVRRALCLSPYVLTLLAWQIPYALSDAGSRASGVYLHPYYDFSSFLAAFPERVVSLLSSVWGLVPSEVSFLGRAEHRPFVLGAGVVTCVAAFAVAHRHLCEDRALRFWALGMVLSLVPVAASFPSDRLLLPANLGAMALVARFACAVFRPDGYQRLGRARMLGGLCFVGLHGVLAPLILPVRAHSVQQLARAMGHSVACLEEIENIQNKTLLVLGGPADLWVSYLQAERGWKGLPRPKGIVWLTSSTSALLVHVDERSLKFERELDVDSPGFFQSPPEQLYRRADAPFSPGQRFELEALHATVDEVTQSGAPLRITFELNEPVLSERYELLIWQGDKYDVTRPERIPGEHRIPVAHFFDVMLGAVIPAHAESRLRPRRL